MAASFGEQLRAAREARGVTLRQISDHTRIPMRYLEAIENNDYKPLPGGIFNRSFIKKYANYIGFDEAAAIEGYSRTAREHGSSPDEVNTTPHVPNVYMDSVSTRSPMATLVLMAIILGILCLGVYAGLHWYQRRSGNEVQSPPTVEPQTAKNGVNVTSSPPPVSPVAATGDFKVQIKAVGLPVWVETTTDDNKPSSATLKPGDAREFNPAQKLGLKLAKINTKSLQVSVNGHPAKLPFDTSGKGSSAEFVLTRDEYQKFLQ
jgi:cytoskeleton protein RodZ